MNINFVIDNLWFCVWEREEHIEIAALDADDNLFGSNIFPNSVSAVEVMEAIQKIKDKYDVHLHQLEKQRVLDGDTSIDDIPF